MDCVYRSGRVVRGDDALRSLLRQYVRERFGRELSSGRLVRPVFDPRYQKFLADAHDSAVHCPRDPATVRAYAAFVRDTHAQLDFLIAAGYVFEFWTGRGEPYRNSVEMGEDLRVHRHLFVYQTVDLLPGHFLGRPSLFRGWTVNDAFRIVHDVNGHAVEGFRFTARGEFGAYCAHRLAYSPEAWPALACETVMQSAWVFYGRHRRDASGSPLPGYLPMHRRTYPQQKCFASTVSCQDYETWKAAQLFDPSMGRVLPA